MKRLIPLILILFFISPVWASNTVDSYHSSGGASVITISAIDSDWVDTESRYIRRVVFVPGAADDIMVMKAATASGPIIVYLKSTDGEPRVDYLDAQITLMLDYSDCTFTAGATVIVLIGKP
jgi:hypothetical protein